MQTSLGVDRGGRHREYVWPAAHSSEMSFQINSGTMGGFCPTSLKNSKQSKDSILSGKEWREVQREMSGEILDQSDFFLIIETNPRQCSLYVVVKVLPF